MRAPLYYWDKKENFGDLIGPWIVEELLGCQTINVKDKIRAPGVACVGSIISMITQRDIKVWGAGLISRLDKNVENRIKENGVEFLAVRGWRTYKELTDAGIRVPKIYGDPALLSPRIYMPNINQVKTRKISVVPHFSHRHLFHIDDDRLDVIDVAAHPRDVIDRIASSEICISTSLHGVIVAQAYNIPWLWLQVEKQKLSGTNFKFEDFFTVLDRSSVASATLPAELISAKKLREISLTATLPTNKFSFDDLYESFPRGFILNNML